MSFAVVALALLASDPGLTREPGKKHLFLTPAEIVKRLDASERTYNIRREEKPPPPWYQENARLTWPSGASLSVPARTPDGLAEWKAPAGSAELMDKADAVFRSKDFKAAELAYGEVVLKFPTHYLALIAWGECAELIGKRDVAQARYEKATALVPFDFRSWYHRGNVLLEQGKRADATKLYAHALALAPRSTELLDGLETRKARLGLKVRRDLFVPAARVELTGEDVTMSLLPQPQWVAWVGCKALWLGESTHREEMTGHAEHVFTNIEEEECLLNLAASYETVTKAQAGYQKDSTSQLVFDVSQAQLLTEFVMFEIGSRVDPQVTLRLPDEYLPRIEEMIRKFVLVPVK